jgi:hypothetical protein
MVNRKLKNFIKKLILKEADDYLQDFSSFGPNGNDNKNRLRQFLTTKNLSNTSISPKGLSNFPNKGDELSLFSLNIKNLNPIERSMLKQSIKNGNIQHKVENGVVSFSRRGVLKVLREIENLIDDEFEHAKELYKEFFLKNGDSERTKTYEKKLLTELGQVKTIADNLARKIIDELYNDENLDEAYVDDSGKLQDFTFSRNLNRDNDMYGYTDLPPANRFKMDGETYVRIIIPNKNEIVYQNKSTRKNVNIIEFFNTIFEEAKKGILGHKLTALYQKDIASGIEYLVKEDESSLILKGVNEKFEELYGDIENYLKAAIAEYKKEADLASDYEEEDYKSELKDRFKQINDRLEYEYTMLKNKHNQIYRMFR